MKRIVIFAAALLGLTLTGAPGFAQEAIRTGDGGAPPVVSTPSDAAGATPNDPVAGGWARRGLGAAPAEPGERGAPSAQCSALKADGKPHGEVWAGVGNQRYREVGGVVTQPLGPCGSVTVMIDRTQGGYGRSLQRR